MFSAKSIRESQGAPFVRSSWRSPIGCIELVSERSRLIAAFFEGNTDGESVSSSRYQPASRSPSEESTLDYFHKRLHLALENYFAGDLHALSAIPISPSGASFREKVWAAISEIPPGETATYGDIAERISSPLSARAVGNACKKNPILLFIPCHRVVPKHNGPGLYSGGPERKSYLIELEKGFAIP